MRLDRFLSKSGFGSRSEVKKLIKKGLVEVNGSVVKVPSFQVNPKKDEVTVEGEPAFYEENRYLILNKPAGYVTSTKDRELTVMELISDVPRFQSLFPVGRLDKDAEGLLLLTDDGLLAHRLTHPRWKVPKTYYVIVEGRLTEEKLEPLKKGLNLGDFTTKPAEVKLLGSKSDFSEVEITITEGKYHQVKRMFKALGFPVRYLKRIKFGNLELGELPLGEYRHLTEDEVKKLKQLVGL